MTSVISRNNDNVPIDKLFRVSWDTKQSGDSLTASDDVVSKSILVKPSMLRRRSLRSEWKVPIMANIMAFIIADGFID